MTRHAPHPDRWPDDGATGRSDPGPGPAPLPGWCHGLLVAALVALLLLPVVLTVIVGLGGLLRALHDDTAARVCDWMALVVGAAWATSLLATTALSAVAILAARHPRPARRPRMRRRRRRVDGATESGGA